MQIENISINADSSITQFSSVQSLSRVRLFATPWIAAHQASLSITDSRSSCRLTSIESVMPSSHLILCRPLLLLPPIPPSIRQSWPKKTGGEKKKYTHNESQAQIKRENTKNKILQQTWSSIGSIGDPAEKRKIKKFVIKDIMAKKFQELIKELESPKNS